MGIVFIALEAYYFQAHEPLITSRKKHETVFDAKA
jgi:hypothetical protein